MIWRRLPIRPTGNFAALVFVLAAMWYAASNQNNAPAYLLLFALAAVALVSIPHTISNLGGLKTTLESVKPAFAGEEVSLSFEIVNHSRASRQGIVLRLPGKNAAETRVDEIPGEKAARVVLQFPALARGEYEIDNVCLTSSFPLGFVKAKKCLPTAQRYFVYPNPKGHRRLPTARSPRESHRARPETNGGDNFSGVRPYVSGESQRHIDWKAVARGQAMMTKQFTTDETAALYLDLAAAQFNTLEERLSQLALWVIEAERAHRPYGLRLPGVDIPPSLGTAHFHRCQRTLAVFK